MHPRRAKAIVRASAKVATLSAANILQLSSQLIVTILLGRSGGPEPLGVLALALAAGSVMQGFSAAGMSGVALTHLLKPRSNRTHEFRLLFFARLFVIPLVFSVGYILVSQVFALDLAQPSVLCIFFIGYAIGAFDVAELSHTSHGHFHLIATRRIAMLSLTAVPLFVLAHAANLNGVLLLLAIQSALRQLVLFPGSGISLELRRYIRPYWKETIAQVWSVRLLWASSVVGSVASRIDLFIVTSLMSVIAAGQYSTASRPIEATTMVAGSLIAVLFNPIAKGSHDPVLYAQSTTVSARAIASTAGIFTIILCFFGPSIIRALYGEEFYEAAAIVPIYALSIVFIFQKRLLDRVMVLEGCYGTTLTASVATIAINVGLNLVMIPHWGLTGAAIAAVVTHPLVLIAVYLPTRKGRGALALAYGGTVVNARRLSRVTSGLIQERTK
jgi:O-antigen/teichoic acid export membrane protein